ncbi:MAG: hypothetical protein AABW99_01540 [archaeon]
MRPMNHPCLNYGGLEALEQKIEEKVLTEYMKSPEDFMKRMEEMEKQLSAMKTKLKAK